MTRQLNMEMGLGILDLDFRFEMEEIGNIKQIFLS